MPVALSTRPGAMPRLASWMPTASSSSSPIQMPSCGSGHICAWRMTGGWWRPPSESQRRIWSPESSQSTSTSRAESIATLKLLNFLRASSFWVWYWFSSICSGRAMRVPLQ